MSAVTRIYLSVIFILLAIIVGMAFGWQSSKDKVQQLTQELTIANQSLTTQRQMSAKKLSDLRESHITSVNTLIAQHREIEMEYRGQLNQLSVELNRVKIDNQRLREKLFKRTVKRGKVKSDYYLSGYRSIHAFQDIPVYWVNNHRPQSSKVNTL